VEKKDEREAATIKKEGMMGWCGLGGKAVSSNRRTSKGEKILLKKKEGIRLVNH